MSSPPVSRGSWLSRGDAYATKARAASRKAATIWLRPRTSWVSAKGSKRWIELWQILGSGQRRQRWRAEGGILSKASFGREMRRHQGTLDRQNRLVRSLRRQPTRSKRGMKGLERDTQLFQSLEHRRKSSCPERPPADAASDSRYSVMAGRKSNGKMSAAASRNVMSAYSRISMSRMFLSAMSNRSRAVCHSMLPPLPPTP